MEEYTIKRNATISHNFFKTQKHYVDYCNKVIKDRGLNHPTLNEKNFAALAWFLSKYNLFKRKGIKCISTSFSWMLRKDDAEIIYSELDNIYTKVIEEIVKIKKGAIKIEECDNLFDNFLILDEVSLIESIDESFTEEFLELLCDVENKSGVYFFYDSHSELIYIGKSYRLNERLKTSCKERKAIYVNVMVTDSECDANILEPYYIGLLNPQANSDFTTLDNPTFEIKHNYNKTEIIPIYNLDTLNKINKRLANKIKKNNELIDDLNQELDSSQPIQ